jgi:hypothetical protein
MLNVELVKVMSIIAMIVGAPVESHWAQKKLPTENAAIT